MNENLNPLSQADILIVDDNPNNLRFLSTILKEKGYQVRKALNGEMTLTACEALLPDLILLDIMMPDLDGYQVCQALKANPKTQKIPVIFLSALDEGMNKVKAFQSGGIDYVSKPFQVEEVLARVENQLIIQHLQQELVEKNKVLEDVNQNLQKIVKQKIQQLIEQEKTALVGRLTQGMVHNLRNPLQTILMCSESLEIEAEEKKDESLLEDSQAIKHSALVIREIMDNLMVKTNLDYQLEFKSLNLNDILNRELQVLTANLDFKHKIKKVYEFDEAIPNLSLIYSHISQIIHNLINNAIDAMWKREEKEIRIITRQDESNVYLDIIDKGEGIPLENLSTIFDPFYTSKPIKGEEVELDQPTGTGLGLYTCVELLKPFQGELLVKSEVGKGSVFTIVLPKSLET